MKTCSKCGVSQPDSKFPRYNICKTCNYESARKRRAKYYKERMYKKNEYLSNKQCAHCGFSDYRALEFHHIDPSTKVDSVSNMIFKRFSWKNIMNEIKKCIVLCSNCHAIVEHEKRKNTYE